MSGTSSLSSTSTVGHQVPHMGVVSRGRSRRLVAATSLSRSATSTSVRKIARIRRSVDQIVRYHTPFSKAAALARVASPPRTSSSLHLYVSAKPHTENTISSTAITRSLVSVATRASAESFDSAVSESSTLSSGTMRTVVSASTAPTTVPPILLFPPRSLTEHLEKTSYIQPTTLGSLRYILGTLAHAPTNAQRQIARETYDTMMNVNLANIRDIETRYHAQAQYGYGSQWIIRHKTPLEANVMMMFTYPPEPWPDWSSNSPTMNRLSDAGVWNIVNAGHVSFLHLHNHSHITETRADARNAHLIADPSQGRWPGDPVDLVDELEKQATDMVCARMAQKDREGLLIMNTGEYARDWFYTHHARGRFEEALGYAYTLDEIDLPVSRSPDRNLTIQVLQPNTPGLQATVAVINVNSAAFVCHEINDNNDCVGKALRLDAALELLRSCFGVSAAMDTKKLFENKVYTSLEDRGLMDGRHYTSNLFFN